MSLSLDDHLRAKLSDEEASLIELANRNTLPSELMLLLNWMLHEADIETVADQQIRTIKEQAEILHAKREEVREIQKSIVEQYEALNSQMSALMPTLGDKPDVLDRKAAKHEAHKLEMEKLARQYYDLEPQLKELDDAYLELEEGIENADTQLATDLAPWQEKRKLLLQLIQYAGGPTPIHPRLLEVLGLGGNPFDQLGSLYRDVLRLEEEDEGQVLIDEPSDENEIEEVEMPVVLPSPAAKRRQQRRKQRVHEYEARFGTMAEFFGDQAPDNQADFLRLTNQYRYVIDTILEQPNFAWISDGVDRNQYLYYYRFIAEVTQPSDLFVIYSERVHGATHIARALSLIHRHHFPEDAFQVEETFKPLAAALAEGRFNGTRYWYENDCHNLIRDYLVGNLDLDKVIVDEPISLPPASDDDDFEAQFAAMLASEEESRETVASIYNYSVPETVTAKKGEKIDLNSVTIDESYVVTQVPALEDEVALRKVALWAWQQLPIFAKARDNSIKPGNILHGGSLDRFFVGGFARNEDKIYSLLKTKPEKKGSHHKVGFDYIEIVMIFLIIRFEKIQWKGLKEKPEKLFLKIKAHLEEIARQQKSSQ